VVSVIPPLAAGARFRDVGEVLLPELFLPFAEHEQIVPRIDPRVVAIGKRRAHRITANRFDFTDADVLLPDLQDFLAGTMAPNVGRRRIHPQVFIRQLEAPAVFERDLHPAGLLMKLDVGGYQRSGSEVRDQKKTITTGDAASYGFETSGKY
jgi:hypothetical protein